MKSRTRLSEFTFTFHFHVLEKEMATHSRVLAWRIPGTEEWCASVYGVTQSQTRLKRLSRSSSSWRRDRLPTLVFLGFPDGSPIKNLPANAGTMGSIPGLRRSPRGRAWQPTPVFLPGESHGQRLLLSCFSHVQLCVTPWTAAHQASLSLGF